MDGPSRKKRSAAPAERLSGVDEMLDLRRHAAAAPQRRAVVCGKQSLTYGELEALANRIAATLRDCGLQRGDHIAMHLANRPETLAVAWAAWRTGLYLTPLPTTASSSELHYLCQDCDAKLVFIDDGPHPAWLPAGVRPLSPSPALLAGVSPLPAEDEPPGALMMYTSGTTGTPKGVFRPLLPADWRGTPPFAADLIALFGIGGSDVRYLSTAPLYHAAPLRTALAVTAGGGTVFVMERFDAEAALQLLQDQAITHSQWVPAMFQRLLSLPDERRARWQAPAHRSAIHGAAPCPAPLKRAMIEWWGPILLEYYSGSEGIGLTLIDSHEALLHPGSVGRARKGVPHIVDEAGAELPPGRSGLVCFSGVSPFAYYKAPKKTVQRTTLQGWQTFGDIGHVDADGYLYLTDRLDDMIISGGVNVYPQEIEAVLREAPGVWDCAVVGQADERFGERPVAFVVAARGTTLSLDALRCFCETRLGRTKQPVVFHVIDTLPRSPTGKLLRRQLRTRVIPPSHRRDQQGP